MTLEARDVFFRVKDLLVNASQLVLMNETDPLILYTDASAVPIGGVLQNGVENPSFLFLISCRINHEMRNHGARVVRFRLLRQTTYSLSYGKTLYSEDGP